MARLLDKEKAIQLRRKGMSYSQIKEVLKINKSTLSGWLAPYPLSPERIRELRDVNPRRIESYRNTMRKKREERFEKIYTQTKKDIGKLKERDIFIGGLFLYWAEGSKTTGSTTALTNTNPSMLLFFIYWLENLGIDKKRLRVKLHLYSDMDIKKQTRFWSKTLRISANQFRKVYIKKSKLSDLTYRNGFGQGTCTVLYENKPFCDYVLSAIKYFTECSDNMGAPAWIRTKDRLGIS